MRKTTQTFEFTVEGPNEDGMYQITGPLYETAWLMPEEIYKDIHRMAVQQHIDSAPKVVEFEGYLIGPHQIHRGLAAWELADRKDAEEGIQGLTSAATAEDAYEQIAKHAENSWNRQYIAPTLAIAHYMEQKEANNV